VSVRGLGPTIEPRSASRRSRVGAIGPGCNAHLVAGTVGDDPSGRGITVVYEAAPCGERRRDARLRVLSSNRDVDVHRVAQRLVRAEFLHPDGRAVAQRVDRVVVGERFLP